MTPKELNAIALKLAKQVKASRQKSADIVPPGWFTVSEMCKQTGRSDFAVARHLKLAGAEKRDFTIQTKKAVRAIPHYKLK